MVVKDRKQFGSINNVGVMVCENNLEKVVDEDPPNLRVSEVIA